MIVVGLFKTGLISKKLNNSQKLISQNEQDYLQPSLSLINYYIVKTRTLLMNKINTIHAVKNSEAHKIKSPASIKSKLKKPNDRKNMGFFQEWKNSVQSLPTKQWGQNLPVTKSEEDQKNHYKYKDQQESLHKRSELADVSKFILRLINKSETQELTNTEKYMLAGYIDVYIKEKYVMKESKDVNTLSIEKLKADWIQLCNAFELYKVKSMKCRIGENWEQKQEENIRSFETIYQEISNLNQKKQKLEQIRKSMKKFYSQLVS